jgi:hypothetical protein
MDEIIESFIIQYREGRKPIIYEIVGYNGYKRDDSSTILLDGVPYSIYTPFVKQPSKFVFVMIVNGTASMTLLERESAVVFNSKHSPGVFSSILRVSSCSEIIDRIENLTSESTWIVFVNQSDPTGGTLWKHLNIDRMLSFDFKKTPVYFIEIVQLR